MFDISDEFFEKLQEELNNFRENKMNNRRTLYMNWFDSHKTPHI